MDHIKELEEKLREVSSTGDHDAVNNILMKPEINVNSQHAINGWTALHWAAHRGHYRIVSLLLTRNADKTIKNKKGETALQLATDSNTRLILGGEPGGDFIQPKETSIVPNYLANPPFPYMSAGLQSSVNNQTSLRTNTASQQNHKPFTMDNEMVIKARVANSAETDFIEVEFDRNRVSFDLFLSALCTELNVKRDLVSKVRKLPNTILRKDKDIWRLSDFQEVELVLSNRAHNELSRNYGPSVSPKHVDVVY